MDRIPNLRHLRLFSLTARYRSGRKAADEARVSQPAVAQAIAGLERRFRCILFDRRSTGMYLTRDGEIIRNRVDRGLDLLAEAARRVSSDASNRRRPPPLDRAATVVQLMALTAVVRSRSFATAARELGMAPSSVHRAVLSIERLAGEALIERHSRATNPTLLGLELASIAARALREVELAFCDIDAEREGKGGTLRIGVLPFSGVTIVAHALKSAGARYPDAELCIEDGSYDSLLRALRIGDIDVIVGALGSPRQASDVVEELLFVDKRLVICRAGHPLAKRGRIEIEDVARYDWVVPRRGTTTRVHFDALLGPAFGAHAPRMIETGSFSVLRGLLLHSNRLALVSHQGIACEEARGGLAAVPIGFCEAAQSIGLTMRRDWRPTRFQASVLDLLRDAGNVYASTTGPSPSCDAVTSRASAA